MVLPPPNLTVDNAHLGAAVHGKVPTVPGQKRPSQKKKTPPSLPRKPCYSSPLYKKWKKKAAAGKATSNLRQKSTYAPRASGEEAPVHAPPTKKYTQSFRRLPPVIRTMIWEPLLEYKHGKMPNLIKALRADRELHQEIMCLFYKQGFTYNLNQWNHWSLVWMSGVAIKSIRNLKIEINYAQIFSTKTRTKPTVTVPSLMQIDRVCKQLPNVTSVTLQSYLGGCHNVLLRSWDGYLSGLGNQLRKVVIDFRFEPLYNPMRQFDLDRMLIRTYKNANKLFGVHGHKVFDPMSVGRKGRSNRRENNVYVVHLVWEVTEEGKTMEIRDKEKRLLG